jgi:3-methyladenine DNA glycosylase/8-oxoguanine DNA glycosylase
LIDVLARPRGVYSLALTARLAGDATRRFRDGVFTARLPERAEAWQLPDGRVRLRAESEEALERLRFVLALDDDDEEFLRRFSRDPLLGASVRGLRGLRVLRTATVAGALLRAVCGQLIDAKTARRLERGIVRSAMPSYEDGFCEPVTRDALARLAPVELRRLGLAERKSASLVRFCRSLDPERLHGVPTATVVARITRERGLGPWSAGVVCLEGLGRPEHGLVGDLGLVKLLAALRGRWVEGWETAELLEPYGEWAGLASVYLLAGFGRGLVPVPQPRAA